MSLSDVRHQDAALRRIQQALSRDRVPHAYLFHGPEGVGKERVARGLAQLLLCSNPTERELGIDEAGVVGLKRVREGCGRCEDCRLVSAQTHPDFHVIYRQLHRDHPDSEVRKRKGLELGVDVLRHFVIDKVGLTPLRGRAKLFVIRAADDMTVQAQNALLKTLEEPPGSTFIILLVSALDRLLPTTLSRCQLVRFDGLPEGFIRDKLHELRPELSRERIEWCARGGEGSLGRALEYADDELFELHQRLADGLTRLGDPHSDGLVKAWTDEAAALGERYRKRDPDITDAEATRRGLATVFQLAAGWYGDVLRNCATTAQFMNAETVAAAINRLAEAQRQLDLNANTQLIVETLVGDLAGSTAV
jgi:DNA polymerase-3 subunit delta'